MDWLIENGFFFLILLVCVGMHLLHRHGDRRERGDEHGRNRH